MLEEKRQNLAETDRESYYNQGKWLERFLDDKCVFCNGSKSDDSDDDGNFNENNNMFPTRPGKSWKVLDFLWSNSPKERFVSKHQHFSGFLCILNLAVY